MELIQCTYYVRTNEVYCISTQSYTQSEYIVMTKKAGRLNIRIDDKLKKRLERQAKKEDRSVSNMILKVMRDYLDEKEYK